jgi:hypothetical protein
MLRPGMPGLAPVLDSYARGDRDGASQALFEHFRARPRADLRTNTPLSAEQVVRQSDQVLSSVFELIEGLPVQLEKDIFWGEDPLQGCHVAVVPPCDGYVLPPREV